MLNVTGLGHSVVCQEMRKTDHVMSSMIAILMICVLLLSFPLRDRTEASLCTSVNTALGQIRRAQVQVHAHWKV